MLLYEKDEEAEAEGVIFEVTIKGNAYFRKRICGEKP